MSTKLYVGNLAYSVTDESLQSKFAELGNVISARVIVDRASGRSKGFGFVEMESPNEAQSAIEKLNGAEFLGRAMNVSEARPQEDRPRTGGGGGGGGFRRGGGGGGGGSRGPRGGGGGGGGRY